MRVFISFLTGLIFSIGLGISGMTQTQIVRGFLDITGEWNYSLIGVMSGAILVHGTLFYFIKKRSSPLLDTKFHVPNRKDIDARLIMGAALFGLGWGWAGICPGPGLVSLVSGDLNIVLFIASMLLGMGFFKLVESKIK